MKKIIKISYTAVLISVFSVSRYVFAAPQTPGPAQPAQGGTGLSYSLKNPLAFDSLQDFIVAILDIVIIIATPIIVLFIVFAGFQYVTARGEPGKIKSATQALTYAVIGGVLVLGATVIAEIIKNLVNGFAA